ncbi:MAG: type II toxin-antitoxin system prevent-host-death family antitoxin [bacterium]|nr:type II toxin-antitoxin system prevent-host-death family antitoxin [bacterium]
MKTTVSVNEAISDLNGLMNDVYELHKPIHITDTEHPAVIVSEEDWNSIQNTLHFLSTPEIRKSVIESIESKSDECNED